MYMYVELKVLPSKLKNFTPFAKSMVEWRLNSLEETENVIVFHSKFYIFYLFRSSANESISYWTLFLFFKRFDIQFICNSNE